MIWTRYPPRRFITGATTPWASSRCSRAPGSNCRDSISASWRCSPGCRVEFVCFGRGGHYAGAAEPYGHRPTRFQRLPACASGPRTSYVGTQSGIMDQFISCCGAAGHALLLDCRDLSFRLAQIPDGISLVICNTMVKHSHAGGEYNTRRAEMEAGVDVLRKHRPEIRVLRDATMEDLDRWGGEMSVDSFKRCRHVITENARTVAAADALERDDLPTVGRLMAEAHASYRDDFEASCPEADTMVELAQKLEGCIGARLTGGGFGGCTVNLVETGQADSFIQKISAGYRVSNPHPTGNISLVAISRGASG